MVNDLVHIVMPVKDSWATAEAAIRAVLASGYTLTVYDDYSTPENAARLDALRDETCIEVVHVAKHTEHPSPNYRWVLIEAQRRCLEKRQHLVIVESDVLVKPGTIERLAESANANSIGLVAAVTTDEQGDINFPYEYAKRWTQDGECKKRLSFCCTLLTNDFLRAYDFQQLDPKKNWYDVYISRKARQLGFGNILQVTNCVVHKPHSSRPWKHLKKTNPLLYYWNKLIHGRDKI